MPPTTRFPNWVAFNEMIGVGGWRGRTEKAGPFWYYKDGKLISDTAPGPAGSHGQRTPFQITVRENHPITNGLPKTLDASGRRAVCHAARSRKEHDGAGDRLFRSRKQRHRPR